MDLMPKMRRGSIEPEINEEFLNEENGGELSSPKRLIEQEEIFEGLSQEKEIESPTPIKKTDTDKIDKIIEGVKPVKKKRQMTEEHKQKLALARGKALETRRRNAREKKEMKELQKLKKQQELDQLRQDVGREPKSVPQVVSFERHEPAPAPAPAPLPVEPTYTKQQLIDAQARAVVDYETIRLKRKGEKKKKQETENIHNEKMRKAIARATSKGYNFDRRMGYDRDMGGF